MHNENAAVVIVAVGVILLVACRGIAVRVSNFYECRGAGFSVLYCLTR